MTVKELLKDYQWVWKNVFIYSFDWYSSDNKKEQESQDKMFTVFSTKSEKLPYYTFSEDVEIFSENTVYAWWCDEKGLGIMLNEDLTEIKRKEVTT